jgi:hypothetical protein
MTAETWKATVKFGEFAVTLWYLLLLEVVITCVQGVVFTFYEPGSQGSCKVGRYCDISPTSTSC